MSQFDELLSDRELFQRYVYTDYASVVEELEQRRRDPVLSEYVKKYFPNGIPEQLAMGPRSVLFRQVATPNFEIRRFLFLTSFGCPTPLLWEYHDDKFTPNNSMKKYLGKMPIITGYSRDGSQVTEFQTIIDFNQSSGTSIRDVITTWGERLVDFHHSLFSVSSVSCSEDTFFDASGWFKQQGSTAKEYYVAFMALFLQHAVWFENFLLEDPHEREFLEQVVLPGFDLLYKETGYKPLVIALEPTEIEAHLFWHSYPKEVGDYIQNKLH